jgi:hypothetical protein
MKMKILAFIICILLIAFSTLTATGVVIDNRDVKEHLNFYNNLKQQTNSKSGILDFWTEQDKLLSSAGTSGDFFGCSVSIDGNHAVIGAYGDNGGTGSAYIFIRSGTIWTEAQKLTASDGEAGDHFGSSVSIHENLVIIGAYGDDGGTGSAYIFNGTSTTWFEEQKLTASDGEAGDYFGSSVSINGDMAIVGAIGDDSYTGAVYSFNYSGTTWNELIKLELADNAIGDRFGCSVSFDGTFAIIGAYGDENYSGSAYILEYCCYWKLRGKVNVSSSLPFFGWSVSIDGDHAIIGAPGIPDSGSTGSAYIFKREENKWYEHAYFNGTNNDEYLGLSVSIDGGYAIAGAYGDDSCTGLAYIFNRSGTIWNEEQKLTASDSTIGDCFGNSVSINAGYAIIGAKSDDNDIGSAYMFMKIGIPDLSIEITGGLKVKVKITNNGDNDTKNLDVQIHLKGGIFKMVNKSVDYTIDLLAGESKSLSAGLFLGLGKVFVTASTDFKEKTVYGLQLLFFTYIK